MIFHCQLIILKYFYTKYTSFLTHLSMNNSHVRRQFTQYINMKTCNTKNTNVINQTAQNNMSETNIQTHLLHT